jgi:hypothetical protein
MRFTLLLATLCCVTTLARAQNCNENMLGTWREVPDEASAFAFKIESEPPNLRFTECKPDGTCGISTFLFNYDAKKYKVPPDIGAYFSFQKNGRTIEEKDWVGDGSQLRETDTWAISADGATINQTVLYEPSKIRPDRRSLTNVFNRRGNIPKSADDPFIGYWVQDRSKSTLYEETLRRTPQGTESINNSGIKVLLRCDGKDYPLEVDEGGLTKSECTKRMAPWWRNLKSMEK